MPRVIVFAEFVGVFYTFWFLQAPFACMAPGMDLQAIRDTENYKVKRPNIAQACINIMKQYPWYHEQRTVIFSIADKELLPEVRESIAKMLFNSDSKKDVCKPKLPDQYKNLNASNLPSFVGVG